MAPIEITVHDPELAVAFAMAGIPLAYVKDAEDGPALVMRLDGQKALSGAAALLRMVAANPHLAPDLFEMIARLMRWEKDGQ